LGTTAATGSRDQRTDERTPTASDDLLGEAIRWVMDDPHWNGSTEAATGSEDAAAPNDWAELARVERSAAERFESMHEPSADRPQITLTDGDGLEVEHVAANKTVTSRVPKTIDPVNDRFAESLAGITARATGSSRTPHTDNGDSAIPRASAPEAESSVRIHIGRISIEINEPEPAPLPEPAVPPSLPAGPGPGSSDRRLRRLYLRGF
jgi:hypothetical protein